MTESNHKITQPGNYYGFWKHGSMYFMNEKSSLKWWFLYCAMLRWAVLVSAQFCWILTKTWYIFTVASTFQSQESRCTSAATRVRKGEMHGMYKNFGRSVLRWKREKDDKSQNIRNIGAVLITVCWDFIWLILSRSILLNTVLVMML